MRSIKLVAVLVLLALALGVAAQNSAVVAVRFLVWQTEMSVFPLLAITLGAGFMLGLATALGLRVSRSSRQ